MIITLLIALVVITMRLLTIATSNLFIMIQTHMCLDVVIVMKHTTRIMYLIKMVGVLVAANNQTLVVAAVKAKPDSMQTAVNGNKAVPKPF